MFSQRYHYLLAKAVPEGLLQEKSFLKRANVPLEGLDDSPVVGGLEIPPEGPETPSGPRRTVLYYVYGCLWASGVSGSVSDCVLQLSLNLLGDENSMATKPAQVGTYMYICLDPALSQGKDTVVSFLGCAVPIHVISMYNADIYK